jgi:glycosyltransferase involved in cell wall biosynthesis
MDRPSVGKPSIGGPTATVGIVAHSDPVKLRTTALAAQPSAGADARLVLVLDRPERALLAAVAVDPLLASLERVITTRPGIGAAFNALCAVAVGEAIVLLENGARPTDDAIAVLTAACRCDGIGLAGPATNDAWNAQRSVRRRGDRTPRSLRPLWSITEHCMAVSTEVARLVGPADEEYGDGPCWEMAYAARVVDHDLDVVWLPDAYVHRAPPTARRLEAEATWFERSRERYQHAVCRRPADEPPPLPDATRQRCRHCVGSDCAWFAPGRRLGPTIDPTIGPKIDPVPPRPRPSATARRGPRVTAVMPTAGRPELARRAIDYFDRQTWPDRELVVVDDGIDPLVLPAHRSDVRVVRADRRLTIGAKRNLAVAQASGEVIIHWDDDDWHGDDRMRTQVAPLLAGEADVTALRDAIWFDVGSWTFRRPDAALHRRLFVEDVHGGTLAYRREVWERRATFPDLDLAEDAWFLRRAVHRGARLQPIDAAGLFVYLRHGTNSWALPAPFERGVGWTIVDEPDELARDIAFYRGLAGHTQRRDGPDTDEAMVSCIMPTADRRRFVPHAVACFLAQDHPHRELVVVDDGDDPVADLLPDDPRIRLLRLDGRRTVGEKRNIACEAAAGSLIAHWDDDDHSHPERLSVQVHALLSSGADVVGQSTLLWHDIDRSQLWRYRAPRTRKPWVAGNTLLFRRSTWERARFPVLPVGEDTAFVWGARRRVVVVDDERLVIGTIHGRNTSPKRTIGPSWELVGEPEAWMVDALPGWRSETRMRGLAGAP